MSQRTETSRTFCLHCGGSFPNIWGLKAHQDACADRRRRSRATGLAAALLLPLAGWLAAPSAPPADMQAVAALTSTVPAGAAEAPELVPVAGSALRIEVDDHGVETVYGPHALGAAPAPAPVAVEVEAPPVAAPPAPEGACWPTVTAYLRAWDATGVKPGVFCVDAPAPSEPGAPGSVARDRSQDPAEWSA